jgi:hypothetical protein
MAQNMRLGLIQIRHVALDEQSDAMRRPMNAKDQSQIHTISYNTNMDDIEFVRAFESCELPPELFHHRDHIRLAWIYLHQYGAEQATVRIASAIRNYAAHLGVSAKYSETVTVAWMRLLAQAPGATFDEITRDYPQVLSKDYLREFYSDAALSSDAAKTAFVEPDKKPLMW